MNPNPLNKADLSAAKNGLYECRLCAQELERCKACDLDVSEYEARNELLMKLFTKILENYPVQAPGLT